jgi:hypothetical protein
MAQLIADDPFGSHGIVGLVYASSKAQISDYRKKQKMVFNNICFCFYSFVLEYIFKPFFRSTSLKYILNPTARKKS